MNPEKPKLFYQDIDGAIVPSYFNTEMVRESMRYTAKDDDIFIVTFPKCGTTWTEVIVHGILNNGKPFDQDIENYFTHTPFLEYFSVKAIEKMKQRGTIKTHLSLDHVPYNPKAKYIYVTRDPRDACVSFYEFMVINALSPNYQQDFNSFCESFIEGNTIYGDYFKHLEGLTSRMNQENLLVLSYEQMKKDLKANVLNIAEFLEVKLDHECLQKIIHHSSFGYMKGKYDLLRNSFDEQQPSENRTIPFHQITIVRKGITGDYRSIMTAEQIQRLLELAKQTENKIPGLKLLFD